MIKKVFRIELLFLYYLLQNKAVPVMLSYHNGRIDLTQFAKIIFLGGFFMSNRLDECKFFNGDKCSVQLYGVYNTKSACADKKVIC